ncbi:HD-GYP domain-containing protein [Niallia sp. 01092]|uniref:HD-GYP domain-containing protein n=1 Tax=unclassified Niallia TaxID=2837522 RepID=UPI003FD16C1A
MSVKIKDLKPGCILAEDVYNLTSKPIITAKTVLKDEHINLLKAFLISEVMIESTQIDGTTFIESLESDVQSQNQTEEKTTFFKKFLYAVQQYKKEFQSWQSGLPVNIANIRFMLLPLFDELEGSSKEIFSLYHLSNKEEYIYQHSVAVAVISAYLAQKLHYPKKDVIQIALAGCLSDAGMAKVSPFLLQKTEPLTEEEFKEVKQHTKYSFKMIPEHTLLKNEARLSIYQHHERLDGSGYPLGNEAKKIHPFAKIIAVADTFHAMTSERLYRRKQSPFKVLEKLQQDYFGKFDLTTLNALSSGIVQYTVGSKVRLSNGEKGEILFIEGKSPTRPLINMTETKNILDLEKNRHLFIEEIL